MQKEKKRGGIFTVISAVICVILAIILISNVTLIVKGSLSPDRPPSVFGITTMMVMSGSMSGDAPDHIEVGDMVVAKAVDPTTLEVGNIITFMENGKTTVTHRIVEINDDGTFTTAGDANDGTIDQTPVKPEEIIGKVVLSIPKLGDVAMFAQTPIGMVTFIGVPLVLYLLLDALLRAKHNKSKKKEEKAAKDEAERLKEELEMLKSQMVSTNAEENAEEAENKETAE